MTRLELLLRIVALRRSMLVRVDREPLDRLLPSLTPAGTVPVRLPSFEALVQSETERFLRRSRLFRTTCLYRSLVRYALLRDAGVPVRFVMGVRPDRGDLTGHAWLELEGSPFMEVLTHHYTRTFVYPPEATP